VADHLTDSALRGHSRNEDSRYRDDDIEIVIRQMACAISWRNRWAVCRIELRATWTSTKVDSGVFQQARGTGPIALVGVGISAIVPPHTDKRTAIGGQDRNPSSSLEPSHLS